MTTVAALRFPFASQNTGRSKYACTFLTVMIAIGWTAGPALPAYAAATPAIINITSRALTAIPAGFSGFNAAQPLNGVEYFDPKFVTATKALNPGWLRFPAGTASMAFDWMPATSTRHGSKA